MAELARGLTSGKGRGELRRNPPAGFSSPESRARTPAASPPTLPLPYYGERLYALTPRGVSAVSPGHAETRHVQFLNRATAFDMYTQRGCTHRCSFCAQDLLPIYGDDGWRNSRRRPLEDVVDYLSGLRRDFPEKNFVYFWDLDFLRRPRAELLHFAAAYKERVALPFFIFVTEKTVNACGADVIRGLAEAGMHTINMGIQSGSRRILQEVYRRHNTPEESLRAVRVIHEATRDLPVEILYDVITYNPEETAEDILKTIRLVASIPADGLQTVRLSTHKLSFNTGQPLGEGAARRATTDYQDFVDERDFLSSTRAPYLSWLLGQMMRGRLTPSRLGNVRRQRLPALLHEDVIRRMEEAGDAVSILYDSFVPQDSEGFL